MQPSLCSARVRHLLARQNGLTKDRADAINLLPNNMMDFDLVETRLGHLLARQMTALMQRICYCKKWWNFWHIVRVRHKDIRCSKNCKFLGKCWNFSSSTLPNNVVHNLALAACANLGRLMTQKHFFTLSWKGFISVSGNISEAFKLRNQMLNRV